jgi:hypothetical protein
MELAKAELEEATNASEREGRREQPQQLYYATATISLASAQTSHQATVVDLSRKGCLLRLRGPAGFEVGDIVELSVQSNDLTFRARASIRHVREQGSLVGLRLEGLTSRGSAYLATLVAELEANAALT